MTNILRVAMLGSGLDQKGGIASIQNLIVRYISSDVEDVEIVHIASHVDSSAFVKAVVFGRAFIVLFYLLAFNRVSIVHLHLSDGGSIFRKTSLILLTLLFKKPAILHAHGAEFKKSFDGLPSVVQKIVSSVFLGCSCIIVLSKYWKKFYEENLNLLGKKIVILENAIEIPKQIPTRKYITKTDFRDKLSIVFFGRIGKRKGAFDLIEAFSLLVKTCQLPVTLTLAGDGELEKLRQRVSELDLNPYVLIKPWVSPQERDSILESADIFVLPSYNEGLPMALLEAMSWGLPVVVTPVGGIPEVICSGENGLFVQPGDVEQILYSLRALAEDDKLRISLGHAARQSAFSFDIKAYCAKLVSIYRSSFL